MTRMGPVIKRVNQSFNSIFARSSNPSKGSSRIKRLGDRSKARARRTFFASPLERTWMALPRRCSIPSFCAISLSFPSSARSPVEALPQNGFRNSHFPILLRAERIKACLGFCGSLFPCQRPLWPLDRQGLSRKGPSSSRNDRSLCPEQWANPRPSP